MKVCVRSSVQKVFVFLTMTGVSFHVVGIIYNTIWTRTGQFRRKDNLRTPRIERAAVRYGMYENAAWFTNNATGEAFRFRINLTTEEQFFYITRYKGRKDSNLFIPFKRSWTREEMYTNEWSRLDLLSMENHIRQLNDTKSPCWRDIHNIIRCLPYMFLIGAPKCGTTDLYKRLVDHPDFIEPVTKEPHWITRNRLGRSSNKSLEMLSKRRATFAHYLSTFSRLSTLLTDERNKTGLNRRFNVKITGDCSASTLWDNDIWTELPRNINPLEPVYTNPHYVYKINPKANIIVLLRDPVTRLYSDYLYFLPEVNRKSPAMFHQKVLHSIRMFTACLKEVSLRSCVYNPRLNKEIPVRLRIGIYYIYLLEWYAVFPKDQILVLKTEEYAKQTSTVVQHVYLFLDLRPLSKQAMNFTSRLNRKGNRRKLTDESVGDMWPETKDILQSFYSTFNKLLNGLLKDKT